jgi:TATA-box binding protein (TBP) (component of TFIID and TFIIIB)
MFKIGDRVIYTDIYKQEQSGFIYRIRDNHVVIIMDTPGTKVVTTTDNIKRG